MSLAARRHANASGLYSRIVNIYLWRLLAIVILIWGEFGAYYWSLASCKWPSLTAPQSGKPTHILLLSDTHFEHPAVHRQQASWSNYLSHLTNVLYLKRSWYVSMRKKPNVVIFLGDMLAGGKNTNSEEEYKAYVDNFRRTFPLESGVEAYYVPGNDDVGMGITRPLSRHARTAYLRTFGPFNQQVVVHNHTFILLDAPGLVDEDYQRHGLGKTYADWTPLHGGSVEFVKKVYTDEKPVILVSHIPLWRKDSAPCGSRRERGNIHQGVGHGYQNTLQKHTSEFLIDSLRPSVIFSGDNRDYCEHRHKLPVSSHARENVAIVPEITLKSFSSSRHIRRPGLQLLSLINPEGYTQSFAHDLCLLPDQAFIHWRLYTGFATIVFLALAFFNIQRKRRLLPHAFLAPLEPSIPLTEIPSSHPSLVTATWTSFVPPTSPRGTLPDTMRTPNMMSGPTFRSASRPGTPRQTATPMLSPMPFPNEEGEEDSLFPSHYANRTPIHEEETWSPGHLDHLGESENGLRPFPSISGVQEQPWSWSWSFVLRGRRHRMTIHLPHVSWDALKDLLAVLGDGVTSNVKLRKRGIMRSTIMDFLSVAWVFVVVWITMAWWSS